jgi:hypothetical protein
MFRGFFAAVILAGIGRCAAGAMFAGYSSNYVQGTIYLDNMGDVNNYDMSFNDPTVIGDPTAGPLAGLTDFDFPPVEVSSPFNPPSDMDQAVTIGLGGQITVAFPQPINIVAGGTIGVFTTVGVGDVDYPNGVAGNPAGTLDEQSAIVKVSLNGQNWVSLGLANFDNAENYFTNATSPYQLYIPPDAQVADFGKPFYGNVFSFDGRDYAQMLALLNGSAGGTWLDLSWTGLSQVQYIQFSEPNCQVPETSFLALSAVSAADASVPDLVGAISVPEPASSAAVLILAGLTLRRRRAA